MVFTCFYHQISGFPRLSCEFSHPVLWQWPWPWANMGRINPCHQAMKGATPQTAPLSLGMSQTLGSQAQAAQAAQANLPPDRRRAGTGGGHRDLGLFFGQFTYEITI